MSEAAVGPFNVVTAFLFLLFHLFLFTTDSQRIAVNEEVNVNNEAAKQLNSYSREFFGSFLCRRAGVERTEYFEASEPAKTEVPKVKF